MTQVRRQITIIVSRKPHSVSPFDWGLGYEGLASEDETDAKCELLLRDYSHVKVFSASKLVREHLTRRLTPPKTVIPIGTTDQMATDAATRQAHTPRPPKSTPISALGVPLRIGDRVKVGGHTYRVCKVTESYAIAIPKLASRHLKALKIAPPVTSAVVRFKAKVPATPVAGTAGRVTPKQQPQRKKKRPKGPPVGRHVVAVSSGGGAQVRYGDGRWSRFPMSGGRPDSNRRRH
jgi:hypothetical protein